MHVSVDNLTVSYGNRTILRDLNFKAGWNTTITILGSSGTGKSTFLRVLSGLNGREGQKITGQVIIEGSNPQDYLKSGKIGFMFQEPSLLPHLSVEENIRLPLDLRKTDPSYGEYLIGKVGLGDSRELLPRQLSGGMRTRVALARTLSPKPSLLLLDEPFAALDVAWRFRLYRELATLQAEAPMVTILVTHDIQEALLLSNRILVLGLSGQIERELEVPQSGQRLFESDPFADLQTEFRQLHNFFINEKNNSIS